MRKRKTLSVRTRPSVLWLVASLFLVVATSPSTPAQYQNAGMRPLLFVADAATSAINIYYEGGRFQKPIGRITAGLAQPFGLYMARNGDLYAANYGDGSTSVYHRGALRPYEQLARGPAHASDVALDSKGNVYVVDLYTPKIYVYRKGSTVPTGTLTAKAQYLYWIAIDAKDDVFVNNDDQQRTVEEFSAGSTQSRVLAGISDLFPGGMAFGPNAVLVICDEGDRPGGSISFYAPPYNRSTLISRYPYAAAIGGIALLPNSLTIWGANYGALAAQSFDDRGKLIGQTSSRGLREPYGVAVYPSAGN